MKQCPACGANNSPDAPSCSICGAALSQVTSDVAARTLFGMPAVKIDRLRPAPSAAAPSAATAAAKPAAATPAAAPSAAALPVSNTHTRPGFRALGAVELDGSVGSMNAVPDELARTTVGMARRGFGRDLSDEPLDFEPEADDLDGDVDFGAGFGAGPGGGFDVRFDDDAPADEPADAEPAPGEGMKHTLMGAPSPFTAGSYIESEPSAAAAAPAAAFAPAPRAAPAAAFTPAPRVAPAAPVAPAEDFRTLVGPPGSIAEAARARDAARAAAAREAAVREAQAAAAARGGAPAAPSIIVDQQAFAHSLAAENPGPSVIVDQALDEADDPADDGGDFADVIVDDPPAHRLGSGVRPLPGDADARRGEPPDTAEVKRPETGRVTDRFGPALTQSELRSAGSGQAWVWLVVLIVLAAILFAIWYSRAAYTGDAGLVAPPDAYVARVAGPRAPR